MGSINSNLALYAAVIGSLLPLVIAFIQREHWSSQIRSLVAFAAVFVAGLGTAYFDGDFTTKGVVGAILIVFTTARTTYAALWQPTGVAQKIESATTATPKVAASNNVSADRGTFKSEIESAASHMHIGVGRTSDPVVGDGPVPIPPDADPLAFAAAAAD